MLRWIESNWCKEGLSWFFKKRGFVQELCYVVCTTALDSQPYWDYEATFSSQRLWRETQHWLQRYRGLHASCLSKQFRGYVSLSMRKAKDGTQASNNRHSAKLRSYVLHKHSSRYKLSTWKFFNPFFASGELWSTSRMLTSSDTRLTSHDIKSFRVC